MSALIEKQAGNPGYDIETNTRRVIISEYREGIGMVERNQVYKCEVCGNIVQVLHVGGGQLVCCNQPMNLLQANTEDAAQEKHVPVIEKTADGFKVSVGSTLHPMEEKHYIEWIELIADGVTYRKLLAPGDTPVAEFCVDATQVTAQEYCNLHGLWKAEL